MFKIVLQFDVQIVLVPKRRLWGETQIRLQINGRRRVSEQNREKRANVNERKTFDRKHRLNYVTVYLSYKYETYLFFFCKKISYRLSKLLAGNVKIT